jgi:23S rRNA pseudouridine2605 synthase
MQIRLNKFLSQAGVASRREADSMIAEGKVKVNGQIIRELGSKIDPNKDKVEVEGKSVKRSENLVYLILNKPQGFLVTLKDPFGRPTVTQLLPALRERIFPIGRLDYDSCGLLILTNDGELAFRLAHPRFEVRKTYMVKVKGEPGASALSGLEKGIFLKGKKTAPAEIVRIAGGSGNTVLKVEIYEGRKREVKRMFEAIGHKVLHLQRVGFGGLKLGKLKEGKWRFLTPKEVDLLKKKVGLE